MFRTAFLFVGALALFSAVGFAQEAIDAPRITAAQGKAVNFLKTTQAEDGSWTSPTQPGFRAWSSIRSSPAASPSTIPSSLKG